MAALVQTIMELFLALTMVVAVLMAAVLMAEVLTVVVLTVEVLTEAAPTEAVVMVEAPMVEALLATDGVSEAAPTNRWMSAQYNFILPLLDHIRGHGTLAVHKFWLHAGI